MNTKDMVKREQALQSAKHALGLLHEMSDGGYDALDCFAMLDLERVISDLTRAAKNAEIVADWEVTDKDYNLRGF
jgi:hypothetical protein